MFFKSLLASILVVQSAFATWAWAQPQSSKVSIHSEERLGSDFEEYMALCKRVEKENGDFVIRI